APQRVLAVIPRDSAELVQDLSLLPATGPSIPPVNRRQVLASRRSLHEGSSLAPTGPRKVTSLMARRPPFGNFFAAARRRLADLWADPLCSPLTRVRPTGHGYPKPSRPLRAAPGCRRAPWPCRETTPPAAYVAPHSQGHKARRSARRAA